MAGVEYNVQYCYERFRFATLKTDKNRSRNIRQTRNYSAEHCLGRFSKHIHFLLEKAEKSLLLQFYVNRTINPSWSMRAFEESPVVYFLKLLYRRKKIRKNNHTKGTGNVMSSSKKMLQRSVNCTEDIKKTTRMISVASYVNGQ